MSTMPTQGRFDSGRVVSRAFDLFRRRPFTYLVLTVCFVTLPALASGWVDARFQAQTANGLLTGDVAGWFEGIAIAEGVAILVGAIAYGLQGAAALVAAHDLSGVESPVETALLAEAPRLPMLLLTGLAANAAIGLGSFLVIPGILLSLVWAVAAPVVAVERLGLVAALNRTAALTRGHRGMIFVVMLLYGLASFVLSWGVRAIAGYPQFDVSQLTAPAVILVINPLVRTVSAIGLAALVASIYFELRQLKEGTTAEGLAAVFD